MRRERVLAHRLALLGALAAMSACGKSPEARARQASDDAPLVAGHRPLGGGGARARRAARRVRVPGGTRGGAGPSQGRAAAPPGELAVSKLLEIALGIITGIGGFLETGSLATSAQAGAAFGFQLIWAIALGVICIAFLVEMAGRLAAISHHTLPDAMRERFGIRFFLAPLVAVGLVSFLVLAAEIGGVALALQFASGVSFRVWALPVAAAAWLLLWKGTFGVVEKGASLLGLVTIAFVVGAVRLHRAARGRGRRPFADGAEPRPREVLVHRREHHRSLGEPVPLLLLFGRCRGGWMGRGVSRREPRHCGAGHDLRRRDRRGGAGVRRDGAARARDPGGPLRADPPAALDATRPGGLLAVRRVARGRLLRGGAGNRAAARLPRGPGLRLALGRESPAAGGGAVHPGLHAGVAAGRAGDRRRDRSAQAHRHLHGAHRPLAARHGGAAAGPHERSALPRRAHATAGSATRPCSR